MRVLGQLATHVVEIRKQTTHVVEITSLFISQPHTWLKLENKPHTWSKLENKPHPWSKLENEPHTWSKLLNESHGWLKLGNEPHTWLKLGNEPCMVTVSGTDRDPLKFEWIIIFFLNHQKLLGYFCPRLIISSRSLAMLLARSMTESVVRPVLLVGTVVVIGAV